jgi:hypothetical protein
MSSRSEGRISTSAPTWPAGRVAQERIEAAQQTLGESSFMQDSNHPLRRGLAIVYVVCILGVAFLAPIALGFVTVSRDHRPSVSAASIQAEARPITLARSVRALALSADSDFLDLIIGDAIWQRRDAHTGRELEQAPLAELRMHRIVLRSHDRLGAGIVEPSHLHVVCGATTLWQGRLPEQLTDEPIVACAVGAERNVVVAVSHRGTLWRLEFDGDQLTANRHHVLGRPLTHVALSPREDRAALVAVDGDILMWDVARDSLVERETRRGPCRFAAWSGDGQWLLGYGVDREILVWRADRTDDVQRWRVDSQIFAEAALSHDGRLVAAGDDSRIRIWDVATGREVCTLDGHAGIVTGLVFADNGRTLFSSDLKGNVRRWSLAHRRVVWSTQ